MKIHSNIPNSPVTWGVTECSCSLRKFAAFLMKIVLNVEREWVLLVNRQAILQLFWLLDEGFSPR